MVLPSVKPPLSLLTASMPSQNLPLKDFSMVVDGDKNQAGWHKVYLAV